MAASSARNVVLLTLIEMLPHAIEKSELYEKLKSIWNIFYHICIPESIWASFKSMQSGFGTRRNLQPREYYRVLANPSSPPTKILS